MDMDFRNWVLAAFLIVPGSFGFAATLDLALNWKPEPEFGGFYQAEIKKIYEKEGLSIRILPGGAGQPVAQMVAGKKATFGIVSADEVILARSQGAKIVALFSVYQTDPHGFMVHPERKIRTLKELLQSEGTIALQVGLPFTLWLQKKYSPIRAKWVPYTGGIASFLRDRGFSQQCFITAEPIAARREKLDPVTIPVSESGYDPYQTVVVTHEDMLRNQPEEVRKFVRAIRRGWEEYLRDPKEANQVMQRLNATMDPETFAESARIQRKLIENAETRKNGVGTMTRARWETLYRQLIELKLVKPGMDVTQMFTVL
jgi:NitT/TauT family transport system substrate-binding protein